ncbi:MULTISPECIES: hypothetical protein [unclassified Streptosporangium]|nr:MULTISPECIES: hypothetical protein [unclassified Streptosporangium]
MNGPDRVGLPTTISWRAAEATPRAVPGGDGPRHARAKIFPPEEQ